MVHQRKKKRTESLSETSVHLRHHACVAIDQWKASFHVWWAGPGSVVFPPRCPASRAHSTEAGGGGGDAERVIWAQFPGLDDYSVILFLILSV